MKNETQLNREIQIKQSVIAKQTKYCHKFRRKLFLQKVKVHKPFINISGFKPCKGNPTWAKTCNTQNCTYINRWKQKYEPG